MTLKNDEVIAFLLNLLIYHNMPFKTLIKGHCEHFNSNWILPLIMREKERERERVCVPL